MNSLAYGGAASAAPSASRTLQRCPYRKVHMSTTVRISLGHPILILVYSLVLVLIGCVKGMQ